MSTIYRDTLSPARFKQAGANATYVRFKKAFGTMMLDGIEVFNNRLYWYDKTNGVRNDPQFNRFINKIGLQRSTLLKNNFSHITNCYFFINSGKYEYFPMDHTAIAQDLQGAYEIDDEFEVSVTYGGDLKRYVSVHWTQKPDQTYTVDTQAIRNELHGDPMKYFANIDTAPAGEPFQTLRSNTINVGTNRTGSSTPVIKLAYNDTETDRLYDVLALLDDGTTFEQVGSVYNERVTGVYTSDQYGNAAVIGEYSYMIRYRVKSIPDATSYIVSQCSSVAHALYESMQTTKKGIGAITNHSIDTAIKEAVLRMNNILSTPLFYRGYLRLDVASSMKRKDFVKLLSKCFDSGYTKEKTKWWKKVIAVVIIIVAIVIIALTWWSGAGDVAGGTMLSFGLGLMYGAAFLALSMVLYASAFPEATDMIKLIGNAATIVGYAAVVTGVYNAINQAFIHAALEAGAEAGKAAAIAAYNSGASTEAIVAAGTQAGASAVGSFSTGMFVEGIINASLESVIQMADNITSLSIGSIQESFSNMTLGEVGGWMKNISTGMGLYQQFFAATLTNTVVSQKEQSDKENGVDEYFASLSMMDDTDALNRMSLIKEDMFGGKQTENIMVTL